MRKNTFGPLFRLKQLLEILHGGIPWSADEEKDFEMLFSAIAPRIIDVMEKPAPGKGFGGVGSFVRS